MQLKSHQLKMLKYSLAMRHPALFCDMRGGKTLVTVRRCRMYSDCNHFLVIAPYSALESWRLTLQLEGQEYIEILGNKTEKLGALAMFDSSLFPKKLWGLTNKECYRTIGDELANHNWDVVILDESTFIKDNKTEASRYFVKNFRDVKHRFILTGTPAPEHELNYYQQLQFLDPIILQAKSFYIFRKKHFLRPLGIGAEHTFFISKKGKQFLTERLAKYCCFITRAEIGFDVEPVYIVRKYQFPPAIRDAYKKAERIFILEYKGKELDKTFYSIEVFSWLRRICGGIISDSEKNIIDTHDVKVQGLSELLLGELVGQQVVIWAVYHEEIKMISDMLLRNKITFNAVSGRVAPHPRARMEKEFTSGKVRVLLCQPECYKHGADFSAADTMIYYSSPIGLETRLQSERRIVAMGKKTRLLIIDLIIEDSVDEDILKSLKRKERKSEQIKTIVRAIANRCIND